MVGRQRVLLQSRTPRQMNKKHLSKFPPIIKIKLHLNLELNHYFFISELVLTEDLLTHVQLHEFVIKVIIIVCSLIMQKLQDQMSSNLA